MNVHDAYRCTATYPATCDAPVAYLVEFAQPVWDEDGGSVEWPPADRYTCEGHLEVARMGDVLCSLSSCGSAMVGRRYPAAVIGADGLPYCVRHAHTQRVKALRAACAYA